MPPAEPRVGYVLKRYPRLSETFILTEILAHEAAGLDLEIFSLRAPVEGRFHEALARVRAPVTYLPHERVRATELWAALRDGAERVPSMWSELSCLRHEDADTVYQALRLVPIVLQRGITHLHAHFATSATSVARAVSRMTGIPYSFTAHAKDIFHELVDREALRLKLRDAAAVVTVSDFNLRFLKQGYGDDARAVQRIYNGLDLAEFPFAAPAERPPVILAVGRLVEKKGLDVLVDACALLRDRGTSFSCRIVGEGDQQELLSRRIAEHRLEPCVELVGPLPRGDVIREMRRAAVLAAPCVVAKDGNKDGLPTVLLEAMALGTPCVSTDVTGIPELVRDGESGYVTAQRDAAALADRLEHLAGDAGTRVKLATAGRAIIEREFDIHRNTSAMRRLFAGLTPAARAGTAEVVA